MKINHFAACLRFDLVLYLGQSVIVRLPVKQHGACLLEQTDRPAADEDGTDNAHCRIEPVGSEILASQQSKDRQN